MVCMFLRTQILYHTRQSKHWNKVLRPRWLLFCFWFFIHWKSWSILATISTIALHFIDNWQNYWKTEPSEKLWACREEKSKDMKKKLVNRQQKKSTILIDCYGMSWALKEHVAFNKYRVQLRVDISFILLEKKWVSCDALIRNRSFIEGHYGKNTSFLEQRYIGDRGSQQPEWQKCLELWNVLGLGKTSSHEIK